jgi:hypothetical protein
LCMIICKYGLMGFNQIYGNKRYIKCFHFFYNYQGRILIEM